MGIWQKPHTLSQLTGEVLDDERFAGTTRCLTVLQACADSLEALERAAEMGADDARVQIIVDLFLSLANICEGGGAELRRDCEVLAGRLGAKIVVTASRVDPSTIN